MKLVRYGPRGKEKPGLIDADGKIRDLSRVVNDIDADKAREARQIERLRQLSVESGLDPAFAEKFLNFIVAEVIRHHEKIREGQE